VVGGGVIVLMMVALLIGLLMNRGGPPPENLVDLEQLERDRWQELAPMPTARKGLAVATYDGKIYAIAGETADGVTNVVERYDPATDSWETLPPKPTAVTDVQAVVIGEKIYVPGGKTARGDTLSVFEVYDLIEGRWETRTSLPKSLSSYGLVSYQGELYIFGGWDGEEDSDNVLSFNPSSGEWKRLQPMLDPASSVGATVTSAGILLAGGNNGKQFLSSNILYHANNNEGAESHVELEDIPEGVAGGGIGTIADIVHVMVGVENGEGCRFFKYFTYRDEWECHAISDSFTQSHFGMVELENLIYIIGGEEDNNISSRNLSYIAIYSILIPVLE
jgi:N-acetylneuraminic acid mutarotase